MATAMMNIHQFMKELLTFEDQKIKMVGTADEPWFCARDVCNVLGYNDYRQAISIHVDPEDKMSLYELRRSWAIVFATMAQDRLNETNSEDLILNNETKACYISETGLYTLANKSHLPNAKKFQRWINKEVLPELRRKGQYRMDTRQEDLDALTLSLQEQLRIKDEQLVEKEQQYQQREQQYQQRFEEQQDYIGILKDISVSDNQRNCTEVIYIATCDSYAKRNRFKIGGVQSSDKLQQRLSTYNTRSANGDMFYYSDIFMVADYHHAESRVKDLIGRFVDKKGKEFYQLHYTELREIVKYICERYTEEVEKINEGLSRLVASLNVQRLRPVIPRPTNHASYVNVIDGVPHNKVITDPNEEEFRTQVRHYLSRLLYPVTTIHRRDVFDNIGLKVNKTLAWKWMKQEVGDFNPELLNILQYR